MIKARILISRNPDRSPALIISAGDSIMDVTGQPAEAIPTDPNLEIWELWTEDLGPYEVQDLVILSSEEVDNETPE
jgi:hypothetical protein